MSLQGLVDATATALGGARDMYGPAATATGLPSTAGLQSLKTDLSAAVDSVPTTWRGNGGEGYKQSGGNGVAALDNVIGADGRVGPQVVTASTDSRDGRSGMNTVVSDTRNGVNAIAPSTDTPAGKQVLVNHLDGQLDRAKALLTRSQQRGQMLSAMIRNAGAGYGGGGPWAVRAWAAGACRWAQAWADRWAACRRSAPSMAFPASSIPGLSQASARRG